MLEIAAPAEPLIVDRGLFDSLNRLSPQAVFLLVAGVFGIILCFVTPPVQAPDEPTHWFKVYELSQGKMLSAHYGGDIPVSLIAYQFNQYGAIPFNPNAKTSPQQILEHLKIPLRPRDCRFVLYPSSTFYSILPYGPQTLTLMIARKLRWPALALLYAGRVGTVLGYLLIGWASIRITPILKWPAVMILTNPMALFLAASVSADPITTAITFLATAVVLRCIVLPTPLTAKRIAALTLLMMAAALCKAVYFPLALLVLAVPRRNWGAGYRRSIIPMAIILLSIATFVVWSHVVDADHVVGERGVQWGAGPVPQRHWIVAHKLEYIRVLWRTTTTYFPAVMNSTIGLLGWVDTQLLQPVIVFMYIALAWVCLAYDEPIRLPRWPRIVAAIAFFLSTLLILTATYLMWDGLGDPIITGVAGRYFLPIAPLLCMVFRRRDDIRCSRSGCWQCWFALRCTRFGWRSNDTISRPERSSIC